MESFSRAKDSMKGYCERGLGRYKEEKNSGGGDDDGDDGDNTEILLSLILIHRK